MVGLRLVSFDQSFNLKRPDNREDIFSGRSIGRNVYIGFVEDGLHQLINNLEQSGD